MGYCALQEEQGYCVHGAARGAMIFEVRVQHARFVSCFSGFRLWSGGFRVEGLGFRVMSGLSSGFMGFRVLGHEVEWNPFAFRRPSGSR